MAKKHIEEAPENTTGEQKNAETEASLAEAAAKAKAEAEAAAKAEAISVAAKALEEAEAAFNAARANYHSLVGKQPVKRGPVGVGAFIKEQISAGKTNDEIIKLVKEQFPDNHTNTNCINWYRNALKNWPNGKRPARNAKQAEQAAATANPNEGSDEGSDEGSNEALDEAA